ncbi:hypothetical protein JHK87_006782 [Glycine soja]|nr:hypothetical protein JHK87_006782 [Glycine soja]
MGDRKGDVRIYLISGLFLASTVGGGIFLCICCFKPKVGQQFDNRGKVGATKNCSLTAVVTNPSGKKSPDEFLDDGGRHVHFGAVVEMGSGIQDHQEVADKLQRESKEETT